MRWHPRAFTAGVFFLLAALTPTSACAQAKAPVDPRVSTEISGVDAEIEAANAEDAKYEGGLIKTLIQSRLATLKQTRAMLSQRAAAGNLNVMVRYTADGKPFVMPAGAETQLSALETELQGLKTRIVAAEAEAARYSGGLIQAISLSTVATMKQTQAMLEQKRLALQFALPQFIGFADANGSAPAKGAATPAATPTTPAATTTEKDWEIISVDARVTERNDTWWKYAWKLTIKNKAASAHAFRATIEFQDKDGFIIDSNDSETFVVQPDSDDTATGYALIRTGGAGNVSRTVAKVSVVR